MRCDSPPYQCAGEGSAAGPAAGPRRRIIVATNVAETSLTIPGVTLVVDSGLERVPTSTMAARCCPWRRFPGQRGATQGPCRADRPRAGDSPVEKTPLDTHPPEIQREELDDLVLAAACAGARIEDLDFPILPAPPWSRPGSNSSCWTPWMTTALPQRKVRPCSPCRWIPSCAPDHGHAG